MQLCRFQRRASSAYLSFAKLCTGAYTHRKFEEEEEEEERAQSEGIPFGWMCARVCVCVYAMCNACYSARTVLQPSVRLFMQISNIDMLSVKLSFVCFLSLNLKHLSRAS